MREWSRWGHRRLGKAGRRQRLRSLAATESTLGDFDETVSFDECTLCRHNDGLKAAVESVLFSETLEENFELLSRRSRLSKK